MDWRQFVMNLDSLPAEGVEDVFRLHGALAITYSDAGDEPVLEPAPGETRLWRRSRITGLFDPSADLDRLRADLARAFGADLPPHHAEILEDRDWAREWLRDFRPMRFGRRLLVCPWEAPADTTDRVVLRLDPGLAFGTGTHPTTALCLEWLDGLALAGKRVLDFGSGSGILAIAALLLGAREAAAVDIDPQAVTASRENAARNGVGERLVATGDLEQAGGGFDVVVANVLAEPLVGHAPALCRRLEPGAALALSGILQGQEGAVAAAYADLVDFESPRTRDAWVLLAGTRRG